ncbi:MAG: DUF1080 domain-containing protein [Prevotellaceae bacterium]|jgi:hypothetical protein|nr:DUF1080 domain-containing protein [Prevotellaceae bacterium]
MKKLIYIAICLFLLVGLNACGGENKVKKENEASKDEVKTATVPEYKVLDFIQADISAYETDKDGFITIFDGKTFTGWRGYGREEIPAKWTIEDGAIKFNGTGEGEAQEKDGGDLIFAHKFKNFEFEIEWKASKGGNSGLFYLAQEVENQPIYISAPEYQLLDNENHPDAKQGVDGNRQAGSLYDMIPAKPQNAKPYGEWNKTSITVYKGSIFHKQNGQTVVEYHLWTPQWTEMLQNSKFSQEKWPLAFELLNNCGGENRDGYIGLQDHGDDFWFRNIKIKILE